LLTAVAAARVAEAVELEGGARGYQEYQRGPHKAPGDQGGEHPPLGASLPPHKISSFFVFHLLSLFPFVDTPQDPQRLVPAA
jgi:hypothetical protein